MQVGRLWTALADYYIRLGHFERARDVYEEGLHSVVTVRDFSLIFDALVQFEESLVSAKMEQLGDGDDEPPPVEGDGADFLLQDDSNDVDLRLSRLEWLMERRAELLSSVMLRQNPHNVAEWHKRVHLFEGDARRQVLTYTEAVRSVDPAVATGKLHSLWCAFAHFYEKHGDLANARVVFQKATQVRPTRAAPARLPRCSALGSGPKAPCPLLRALVPTRERAALCSPRRFASCRCSASPKRSQRRLSLRAPCFRWDHCARSHTRALRAESRFM